jgi:hypothetical protein
LIPLQADTGPLDVLFEDSDLIAVWTWFAPHFGVFGANK